MEPRSDHERGLAERGVRKSLGAYYTPPDVVDGLLDLTLAPLIAARASAGPEAIARLRVVDPACGTGNVLVAVARRIADALAGLGVGEEAATAAAVRCVHGVELDAATARACRTALRRFSPAFGARQVVRGDALLDPSTARPGAFDLVVGNPPFLSQLGSGTARTGSEAGALRARFGEAIAAYTDPAAIFLALGLRLARPDGGTVALIEPISLLTARDAAGVRRAVLDDACLTDLWVIGAGVFDASVEVCAPVIIRGSSSRPTRLHAGRGRTAGPVVDAPPPDGRSWSTLLAAHGGLPVRRVQAHGTLADLATATADFRDQYYGLAPHVVERAEADDHAYPPLITSGLLDPAHLAWGRRRTRFNKRSFQYPRVDRAALPATLAAWADARLVPKVLLATQTRVPEAVADEPGLLLPSVPVISVVPIDDDPMQLWRIAAVLTCPAVALEVACRHLGSGRNVRAVRLRAQEVLALPLPADRDRWATAARLLRDGAPLGDVGRTMDEAYGLVGDDDLLAWWQGQLPDPAR